MGALKRLDVENMPGADLYWEMVEWAADGEGVGYRTKGDVPESFAESVRSLKERVEERSWPWRLATAWKGKENMAEVQAMFYSLVMPPRWLCGLDEEAVKEHVVKNTTKEGLLELFSWFAADVNEYYRLRGQWLAAGGWEEEA